MSDATMMFDVEAGVLVRSNVRKIITAAAFKNPDLKWIEQKGFLSSIFSVRGPLGSVRRLRSVLRELDV